MRLRYRLNYPCAALQRQFSFVTGARTHCLSNFPASCPSISKSSLSTPRSLLSTLQFSWTRTRKRRRAIEHNNPFFQHSAVHCIRRCAAVLCGRVARISTHGLCDSRAPDPCPVISAMRCSASYCTKILALGPNVEWAAFAAQESGPWRACIAHYFRWCAAMHGHCSCSVQHKMSEVT